MGVGIGIDTFLTSRPWWWVEKEPFKWSKDFTEYEIVLHRLFDKEWEPIYRQIVETQYPVNCSNSYLALEITGGLDSFGNYFFNYASKKSKAPRAVMTPYIYEIPGNHLFDDKFCSHIKNKYECAFLPATNCSLPDALTKFRTSETYYTSADITGQGISNIEFNRLINHPVSGEKISMAKGPIHSISSYYGLFTGNQSLKTASMNEILFTHFFGYGFLYRLNHHFRSLVSHQIFEWHNKQTIPFPTNGDCVAVIIRRLERVPPGDVDEWCRKHVIYPNGTCYDDNTGQLGRSNCMLYIDYGCQSGVPYGSMSFERVLKAAEAVSSSKNILVRSDDPEWVQEQIKHTVSDKNFFVFTPPSNHRKSSSGAANYMAAIKLASQCNALVGHTGSAVTTFFRNIMCIRHSNVTGACPDIYDFGRG